VRVLVDRQGAAVDAPYDCDLWAAGDDPERPSAIVAPLDPAAYTFDPLTYL